MNGALVGLPVMAYYMTGYCGWLERRVLIKSQKLSSLYPVQFDS
jgi:hypothetical protein